VEEKHTPVEQIAFGTCQCGAEGQLFAHGCAHCHIATIERDNAELLVALQNVEFELTVESSQRLPAKGFEQLHAIVRAAIARATGGR